MSLSGSTGHISDLARLIEMQRGLKKDSRLSFGQMPIHSYLKWINSRLSIVNLLLGENIGFSGIIVAPLRRFQKYIMPICMHNKGVFHYLFILVWLVDSSCHSWVKFQINLSGQIANGLAQYCPI